MFSQPSFRVQTSPLMLRRLMKLHWHRDPYRTHTHTGSYSFYDTTRTYSFAVTSCLLVLVHFHSSHDGLSAFSGLLKHAAAARDSWPSVALTHELIWHLQSGQLTETLQHLLSVALRWYYNTAAQHKYS